MSSSFFVTAPESRAESALSFRHAVFPDCCAGRALDMTWNGRARGADDLDDGKRAARTAPARLTADEELLVAGLFAGAGVRADVYKSETLCRRLPACLRALKVGSVDAARSLLRRRPELATVAIDAMLIGVTGFFRDRAAFAALCGQVLAELAARPAYRVWSAGCSTGAELYSVALLMSELDALERGHLLGTDCRPSALAHAAAGVFSAEAVRDVPATLLERYFDRESGGCWRAGPPLRGAARWRHLDVTEATPTGGTAWDLILCRNLAIYLQPEAASRLWARLADALAPGGVLMLGRAERPSGCRLLEPIGPCLYRRIAEL